MAELTILVAGGGIGGLTLALCLAKLGMTVRLFEQAPVFAEVGAGIQLSPNCTRVLHDLGLASQLGSIAFLPTEIETRIWNSGKLIQSTPLGKQALAKYGFPYYHVHRADLLQILVQAVQDDPHIKLTCNAPVSHIVQTRQGVQADAGGQHIEGALLVGADGIHSAVRQALFGSGSPVFTGNVAWRGLVPIEKLPKELIKPTSSAWLGPGRHFVHYYVRRGELVNCVCVVEKQGWEVESWSEKGNHSELKAEFSGWHDSLQILIDGMDQASCFKWALFDRQPLPTWGKGRITLLGDACHPTLPFLAQGAAMAIEDAAVLSQCLDNGRHHIIASLAQYELQRRKRTAWIQQGSRRNAMLFHMRGPISRVRNIGIRQFQGRVLNRLFSYNALNNPPA